MNANWIHRVMCSAVVVVLSSLTAAKVVSAETQLDFIARRNFRVNGALVAVGDFNGDRHEDLVTARSGTVSILLASRDGSLQPSRDVPVTGTPVAVAVGDLNGDGRQDVATANGETGTVSILLGRGDGNFRPARSLRLQGHPNSIAVADFNRDGHQDLATANGESGTVSVLLGIGDGGFRVARNFSMGTSPYQVTVGDFNGDSRPDLAVAHRAPNLVSILYGKGNGTFHSVVDTDLGEGQSPASIAVGDFNGDGRQDLSVSTFGSDDLGNRWGGTFVLLANLDGSLQVRYIGNGGFGIGTADLDGDGNRDLVVAWYDYFADLDEESFGLQVMLGQGDGTFRYGWGSSSNCARFALGDFDADGHQDLAVDNDGSLSILQGLGDGSFEDARDYPGVSGRVSDLVRTGDFNGDGQPDLATSGFFCHWLRGCSRIWAILLNRGDATFVAGAYFSEDDPYRDSAFAVGDFNDDRADDLVLYGQYTSSLDIYLSKGDGTFLPPNSLKGGWVASSVTVGDFNGDRRQDLAIVSGPHTMSVLLAKGDGTFHSARTFSISLQPALLTVSDFNGDGRQDLAAANSGSNTVSIFLGRGDGSFR